MRQKSITLLIFILTGCSFYNTEKKRTEKVESYKAFFYENQETFAQLSSQIKTYVNQNGLIGELINESEFDDLVRKKLRRLEIITVMVTKTECNKLEVEFSTTWTKYPVGQMYVTKTDCEYKKALKGNYWTDGNFIEVWGLGDNWILWVDSDFI